MRSEPFPHPNPGPPPPPPLPTPPARRGGPVGASSAAESGERTPPGAPLRAEPRCPAAGHPAPPARLSQPRRRGAQPARTCGSVPSGGSGRARRLCPRYLRHGQVPSGRGRAERGSAPQPPGSSPARAPGTARPGPALPPLPPRSTGTAARPGRGASAVPLPGAVPDAGTVACRVPPRRRRGSREAPGAARGAPEGCGFRRRGCPRGLPRASGTRTAPGSSGAERGGRRCPRADGTAAGRGPPLGRGGSGLGPGAAAGSLCAADGEAAEGNGAPLPPPLRRRPRRALLSGLCPVGSGPAAPTALRRGLAAVTGGGCASRGPRGRLKAARESPWPFVSVLFFSRGCKSFVLFPTEVGLKANDLFLFREKSTEPNAPSGAVAVGSKVFAACEGANEKLHPRFFVFFFSSYRGAHNAIGAALSAEKSVVRGWIYNCWQCKAGNICNSKL